MSLKLVIYDCDGVLVDSEGLSRRVIAAEAAAHGWQIDPARSVGFTGLRWSDLQPVFEAESGCTLPEDWPLHMQRQLLAAMAAGIEAVEGAAEALRATCALGLPYRIASNSSLEEMAEKFAATGLAALVSGLCHSAKDVGVGKPAPDLFLSVAARVGVHPGECLVVEDSRPGVTAALRAGMECVAYVPQGDVFGLAALGARTVSRLAEVPVLLDARLRERAA